jgi:uncharacterized protein (TIGR00251 family)
MNKDWVQPEAPDVCPGKSAKSDMNSVLVHVKVVPGSRRECVVGVLGTRLKIRVAALPEDGRANRAACALLSDVFEVPEKNIELTAGQRSAEKTFRITGITVERVLERVTSA